MKEKIRADGGKHWKISKGEVVSSEREVIPVTPAATEVKKELSSSDEEVPVTPVVTRQKANEQQIRNVAGHQAHTCHVPEKLESMVFTLAQTVVRAVMVRTTRTLCLERFL